MTQFFFSYKICSFQFSKDAGFKIVAHMMPDLPNVDFERDVEQFIVILFLHFSHFFEFFRWLVSRGSKFWDFGDF